MVKAASTPTPKEEAFSPQLRPVLEPESPFSTIRQGKGTNSLTKVKADEKRNTRVDIMTGAATIREKDISVYLPDFAKIKGFRASTYQLLDALTVILTENGCNSQVVTMTLEEYMQKRGLKDKKDARQRATEDLQTLFQAQISLLGKLDENGNHEESDIDDMRIIERRTIKKGIIMVTFGTTFYNLLKGYPIMPYPNQLWTLNERRNPNSYYFLRKISEHKNMNVGKKNEDRISVKKLLEASPNIPPYSEVVKSGRQITQRIIEPFERDMNALDDTLSWEYSHSNGIPLTDNELEQKTDYNFFSGLLVNIHWRSYPEREKALAKDKKAPT